MTKHSALYLLISFILFLSGCSVSGSISLPLPAPDYWPTSGWQSDTPESQGMDSALLAEILEVFQAQKTNIRSILIVRNGYLVTEAYFHPYTRDTKIHIQSITKSVIGILIGKAIQDGYLHNAEQPLFDFYPERPVANASEQKDMLQLKHFLSMSAGLDCQEFTGTGPTMEQSADWVQYMLDLPLIEIPGKTFGYCNGNAHLLSAILDQATGMSARAYANQEIFQPLGIPVVEEKDWGIDPQGVNTGGYGLHLRPIDLAKLAFLFLHNGQWTDEQIIPAGWVAESTTQHIKKEDGSGYGYLWTVYPIDDHYAALGLGGQQIHVYPTRNLIVIVTAGLESYAEAPEIEGMLDEILHAIKSDTSIAENLAASTRLQKAIETAAYPVQPVDPLPETALDISNDIYTFRENPLGWETVALVFEQGAPSSQIILNGIPVEVGLDNIFRVSDSLPGGDILLRGRWTEENVFTLDYPYSLTPVTILGELATSEFQLAFTGDMVQVIAHQLIFGGESLAFEGSK